VSTIDASSAVKPMLKQLRIQRIGRIDHGSIAHGIAKGGQLTMTMTPSASPVQ